MSTVIRDTTRICSLGLALAAMLLDVSGCVDGRASPSQVDAAPASIAHAVSPPALSVGLSDEESIGPFASWVDVKAAYGALGNGVADDTVAIQNALNALRKYNSTTGPAVLYFPAGTYRITKTLTMKLNAGANLIGADPSTTSIVWGGVTNGTMLLTSGSFDTLFTRLTWDGKNSAGIGVAQWWNYTQDRANFQGSIKHVDEVFQNLGIGIYGGRLGANYGQGDSETLIERVKFLSNSIAGVNVGSWNALNWWIWDSEFTDCARGVSNVFSLDDGGPTPGSGNFMIYRSLFQRSTVADMNIGNNLPWFSIHNNVSIDSQQFINASLTGPNNSPIVVQNNTVIDTVNPVSIQVGNEGPVLLIDNQIRSLAGIMGPVVQLGGLGTVGNRDVLSLGNQYTVANPIAFSSTTGHLTATGDITVDRGSILATIPSLPGVAQNYNRQVFEVPPGATADQIQAVINLAVASQADNAVVHIPPGTYLVSHTLVIPAQTRLQIAGDAEASTLYWSGSPASGPIFNLPGPSYATLRDMRLVGAQVTAIDIANADQSGGRVFIEGSKMAALKVAGLAKTRVDAQANTQIDSVSANASTSIMSMGAAGLGPISVNSNSNVLVSDSWYEGDRSDLFRGDSGNFTYLGGNLAPYSHGILTGLSPTSPSILVDNFSGQVNFIGGWMTLLNASNGISVNSTSAATNAFFFGMSGNVDGYFSSAVTAGAMGMVYGKLYTAGLGSVDLPDLGRNDLAFIVEGFKQARGVVWETTPFTHSPGATDVRIFRVFTDNTATGLSIEQ